MSITRRDLLKAGAVAATVAALPRSMRAQLGRHAEPVPPIEDPRLKALALQALDAARSAGATYADVRLTHERHRAVDHQLGAADTESMHVGVRTLVAGFWGFAASPIWSPDEMARLAREAVHQAKTNALGQSRPVELAPVPAVADGHWVMPVQVDPFETSPFEIQDFLGSLLYFLARTPSTRPLQAVATFDVQEKAFASTAGSYCTQRSYRTAGAVQFARRLERGQQGTTGLDCLTPAGMGWELFTADFQTTRESASWLTDYYTKAGKPVRSHGCAAAPSAVDAPLQHNPNLTLAPGHDAKDFDALVSGMTTGIAVKGAGTDMDFQHSSGLGLGRVYEIKNGKRVARIPNTTDSPGG
ncbi:MAG: twin-arginine translocation signal domain-containing protein [Gemmatimonadaceae bacterium]|nr:twin-arginine translocation signal domain-containing protein [Gemmatimonadaceae bacterium]